VAALVSLLALVAACNRRTRGAMASWGRTARASPLPRRVSSALSVLSSLVVVLLCRAVLVPIPLRRGAGHDDICERWRWALGAPAPVPASPCALAPMPRCILCTNGICINGYVTCVLDVFAVVAIACMCMCVVVAERLELEAGQCLACV
jgi:hypothetical protein